MPTKKPAFCWFYFIALTLFVVSVWELAGLLVAWSQISHPIEENSLRKLCHRIHNDADDGATIKSLMHSEEVYAYGQYSGHINKPHIQ